MGLRNVTVLRAQSAGSPREFERRLATARARGATLRDLYEARLARVEDGAKAVNGDRVPAHACAAGPADASCCSSCGRVL